MSPTPTSGMPQSVVTPATTPAAASPTKRDKAAQLIALLGNKPRAEDLSKVFVNTLRGNASRDDDKKYAISEVVISRFVDEVFDAGHLTVALRQIAKDFLAE